MAAYLVDNPPRIRQFRPRRAALWPVIGVHTAESFPDETGPDTGAENVADFIRRRTNYGSYHCLSDSDSRIKLVEFDQAAYHIGTHGLNDRTIGISAATQAAKWNDLDDEYVDAMVRNMARDAADAARYIKATTGKTVPARRITLTQALNGYAGFLAHGDADPDRRTDPGRTYPWWTFLAYYAAEMRGTPTPTPIPEDDMPQDYYAGNKNRVGLRKNEFVRVVPVLSTKGSMTGVARVVVTNLGTEPTELHIGFEELLPDKKTVQSDFPPAEFPNLAGTGWLLVPFYVVNQSGGQVYMTVKAHVDGAVVTEVNIGGGRWAA